jgi:hypothetical protein
LLDLWQCFTKILVNEMLHLCLLRFMLLLGPATFPLIGSVPALAMIKEPTQQDVAWSLSRKYGPLSGIYLGPWPVVVVSGYQAIKHVLGREDLAFRPNIVPPQTYFFNARLGEDYLQNIYKISNLIFLNKTGISDTLVMLRTIN